MNYFIIFEKIYRLLAFIYTIPDGKINKGKFVQQSTMRSVFGTFVWSRISGS